MTYIIAEPCIDVKDAACVDVCPVDCIYTEDEDPMYYISPEEMHRLRRLRAGLPRGPPYSPRKTRPLSGTRTST